MKTDQPNGFNIGSQAAKNIFNIGMDDTKMPNTTYNDQRLTENYLRKSGLGSYENGYYQLNDNVTIDCEGDIRLETDSAETVWIGKVLTIDEFVVFKRIVNR